MKLIDLAKIKAANAPVWPHTRLKRHSRVAKLPQHVLEGFVVVVETGTQAEEARVVGDGVRQ